MPSVLGSSAWSRRVLRVLSKETLSAAEQRDEWAVMRRYLTIGPLESTAQGNADTDERETLAMTA